MKNQLHPNSRDYYYDAAGRLTGQWFSDNLRTTLGYDALGRRTTMVDNSGTTTYALYAPIRPHGV